MVFERATPMLIGRRGVVGARGPHAPNARYRNHLPASEMRPLVIEDFGHDVWDESLKFCVVRNPFERAVSLFWMRAPDGEALEAAPFSEVQARFRSAVLERWALTSSQQKYMIDGRPAVDMFIRHSHLAEDVAGVCARVGLEHEPLRLERVNPRKVERSEPASAYFDDETAGIVSRIDPWEMERFGFTLGNAR
jgi:hypothetical protein